MTEFIAESVLKWMPLLVTIYIYWEFLKGELNPENNMA